MKKDNISVLHNDKRLIANKKKYFNGKITLHDISRTVKSREQKIYMVTFHNGAKTKLHYHESGQTLIVMGGNGVLSTYKKIRNFKKTGIKIKQLTKVLLKKGDVIYIPRFTLHWHGATKNTKFSHIAVNPHTSSGKESKTTWFESDFNSSARNVL